MRGISGLTGQRDPRTRHAMRETGHGNKAGGAAADAEATVLEKVRKLVDRLAPAPICDGCVADTLALGAPQRANPVVRQLVGVGRYERRRDICSICYDEKLVTRRVP